MRAQVIHISDYRAAKQRAGLALVAPFHGACTRAAEALPPASRSFAVRPGPPVALPSDEATARVQRTAYNSVRPLRFWSLRVRDQFVENVSIGLGAAGLVLMAVLQTGGLA